MKENYAAMYGQMHRRRAGIFAGRSIRKCKDEIRDLVSLYKPRSMLDYGSGKGEQYTKYRCHETWGLPFVPWCYDPGVAAFDKKPLRKFDSVVCVDVMEHIHEADVDEVLADIITFLKPRDDGKQCFAFFMICTRPAASKRLPDGRNVHLTVRPDEWWSERLLRSIRHSPHVTWTAKYEDQF